MLRVRHLATGLLKLKNVRNIVLGIRIQSVLVMECVTQEPVVVSAFLVGLALFAINNVLMKVLAVEKVFAFLISQTIGLNVNALKIIMENFVKCYVILIQRVVDMVLVIQTVVHANVKTILCIQLVVPMNVRTLLRVLFALKMR